MRTDSDQAARARALLGLLAANARRGYYKLALRHFFMMQCAGFVVPAELNSYCEAARQRCDPEELRRIRDRVWAWAEFSGQLHEGSPWVVDLGALVRSVLQILETTRQPLTATTDTRSYVPGPTQLTRAMLQSGCNPLDVAGGARQKPPSRHRRTELSESRT